MKGPFRDRKVDHHRRAAGPPGRAVLATPTLAMPRGPSPDSERRAGPAAEDLPLLPFAWNVLLTARTKGWTRRKRRACGPPGVVPQWTGRGAGSERVAVAFMVGVGASPRRHAGSSQLDARLGRDQFATRAGSLQTTDPGRVLAGLWRRTQGRRETRTVTAISAQTRICPADRASTLGYPHRRCRGVPDRGRGRQ